MYEFSLYTVPLLLLLAIFVGRTLITRWQQVCVFIRCHYNIIVMCNCRTCRHRIRHRRIRHLPCWLVHSASRCAVRRRWQHLHMSQWRHGRTLRRAVPPASSWFHAVTPHRAPTATSLHHASSSADRMPPLESARTTIRHIATTTTITITVGIVCQHRRLAAFLFHCLAPFISPMCHRALWLHRRLCFRLSSRAPAVRLFTAASRCLTVSTSHQRWLTELSR